MGALFKVGSGRNASVKVTIHDVAKRAEVSIKTVSRVINKEPSVRSDTQEKVLKAVAELNYRPNAAARNLASSRSYAIAYIYDNPNAYYVIDMQNGILAASKEQGYELLIHPCNAKAKDICDEIKQVVERTRVAGVVLTPPFSEMPTVIKTLQKLNVQFVRILSGDEQAKQDGLSILVNDRQAAYSLTQHLIDLGHTDIGFLCGAPEHNSSSERLQGYKSALKDNKIRINKRLILEGEYSFESGVKGAKRLLGCEQRPSAILASNDEIAAGALFAARLMGVAIPDELSIAGFEDSPFSRQTWPRLTTAHQSNRDIAEHATKLLLNRIRQKDGNAKRGINTTVFNPEMVVRESTGPAQNK
jgi:LacI family transcriptional regulator